MTKRPTQTRSTDSRGRLNLGMSLANRTLLVDKRSDGIVLRVVPEREAWLHESRGARESVRRGLRQAQAGKFAR